MSKTVVLIPARAGSVRVPGKNVRVLGKYPLMVWSILTGLEIGETYVSTDSKEYGGIAYAAGGKVVFREAVPDSQTDLDVVRHFIGRVSCDIVVYLRPTTPFREVSVVKRALAGFEGSGLRSVEEMGESAYKCFEIEAGRLIPILGKGFDVTGYGRITKINGQDCPGELHNIIDVSPHIDFTDTPNHQCPKTYHPNGYVDLIRTEYPKKKDVLPGNPKLPAVDVRWSYGDLWGPEKQAFITPRVIEIDTEEDFEYASYWIQRNPPAVYNFGYERINP